METLLAFLKALPEAVKLLGRVLDKFEYYTDKAIDAKFEKYQAEMNETIRKIALAETNDERKKLAKELSSRIGR